MYFTNVVFAGKMIFKLFHGSWRHAFAAAHARYDYSFALIWRYKR